MKHTIKITVIAISFCNFSAFANEHLGNGVRLYGGVSYSMLKVESINFLNTSTAAGGNIESNIEAFDGKTDGNQLDIGMDNLPLWGQSFGISGFYGRHSESQSANCTATGILCTASNLYDATAAGDQTLDAAATTTAQSYTKREVDDLGLNIEWQSPTFDDIYVQGNTGFTFAYRGGLSYRRLMQESDISGDVTRANFEYNEDLRTNYYGGYVGINTAYKTTKGWRFSGNAKIGGYAARTKFNGGLTATSGGVASYNYEQKLQLHDNTRSFTGDVDLSIGKSFGNTEISFNSAVNWLSDVPYMAYNNDDVNDGTGNQVGTEIKTSDSFGLNVGIRLATRF